MKSVEQKNIEKKIAYYECMHRDARTAADIANRTSLEFKYLIIELKQKLERLKNK